MDLSGLSSVTTSTELLAWLNDNFVTPIRPVATGSDVGTVIQKVVSILASADGALNTILHGASNPSSGAGVNGDFFINTTASTIFGPKASGAWGSGISLIGADGSDITPDSVMVNGISNITSGDIWFFGDSITAGSASSDNSHRFTTLLSARLGLTEHNFGIGGNKASDLDLSTIPTKGGTDRFIFVGYGTNEVLQSISTSAFNTALTAITTNILSKGWLATDIVLLSTFGASLDSGDAAIRANNVVIKALAVSGGFSYIELYDSMLNNAPYGLINLGGLHPTDLGHALISELVYISMPALFDIIDQKLVVKGVSEFSEVKLRNYKSVANGNNYLLGVDPDGFVGLINGLRDGLMLNLTYLQKALIQVGAVVPTGWNNSFDDLRTLDSKIYAAYSAAVYNYIEVGNSALDMSLVTTYANGTISLKTVGGTNLIANKDGSTSIIRITGCGDISNSLSPTVYGNYIVFDSASSGQTWWNNTYHAGRYYWAVSGNTDGNIIKAFQINEFGRLISQLGGDFSDIPSARLALNSTTEGWLPPRMTTIQRDAIPSPAEGLEIYNVTTHKKNFYNGTAWEAVTSA